MAEIILPQLDLFSIHPYVLAIEGTEDMELTTVNSIDNSLNNVAEFHCNGYSDRCKMLDEMFIAATIQLVKTDGSLYGKEESPQGHIINGILTSLFKSASLYLNSTLALQINDNLSTIEFIQHTLNFSPSVASSKLSNQGMYPADEMEKLKNHVKGSKIIDLMGKINLLNTDKLLLPSIDLTLKLGFQQPDFYINEETITEETVTKTSSSKLIVKDLRLYIRHVKVRESYLLHIEQTLARNYNTIYECKYGLINTCTIPSGQSSFSIQNLWNGIKPSLLLLCFLKNSTYVGNRKEDPTIFIRHGLKEFSFLINHENFPRNPIQLTINEKESKYARAFNEVYSALGLVHENTTTLLNRENFLTNYFYMIQDISPGHNALDAVNQVLELTNVGFHAQFSEPLTAPLTALLYVLLPRKIEINASRQVSVIY